MTPNQQDIAIAEACGWKRVPISADVRSKYGTPDKWMWKRGREEDLFPPNYTGSLDCMHEAEKTLTEPKMELRYQMNLMKVVAGGEVISNAGKAYRIYKATALQRATAFLRTLGKYTDTPARED